MYDYLTKLQTAMVTMDIRTTPPIVMPMTTANGNGGVPVVGGGRPIKMLNKILYWYLLL